jgi:hypothetical protein
MVSPGGPAQGSPALLIRTPPLRLWFQMKLRNDPGGQSLTYSQARTVLTRP